jgi:hypothetical protein
MINQEIIANSLLWPLWRCVADDYKDKYKKDVWEHFENAIKSASYTDSMKVFLGNFQKRIPVDMDPEYTREILSVIDAGCDEQVLNWLRTESTYIVMIVRIRNQERREDYLKKKKEMEEADKYPGHPSLYPEQNDLLTQTTEK